MNLLYYLPITLLTRSSGKIIGPVSDILAIIMNLIFNFAFNITKVGSLGISIIFFTIIVKFILMPLMINQQKQMKRMQEVQPKIQKIQDKYKNKKDPESQQKMQKELGEFYKKNKVNPFGGCLPLVIQMPIFFALFQVLRNIPAYITKIGDIYRGMAVNIMAVNGYQQMLDHFTNAKRLVKGFDPNVQTKVIDLLSKLNNSDWKTLFAQLPTNVVDKISASYDLQHQINFFLGFNLAENPGWGFPGILLPILAGLTTYLQSKLMSTKTTTKKGKEKDTATQTQQTMNMIFPFMTAFFAVTMPAGLGIYWITSNIFQICQQYIINKSMEKEDIKKKAEIKRKKQLKTANKSESKKKNSSNNKGVK